MDLPSKKKEKAENPAYNLRPFPFSHCSVAAPGTIPIIFHMTRVYHFRATFNIATVGY